MKDYDKCVYISKTVESRHFGKSTDRFKEGGLDADFLKVDEIVPICNQCKHYHSPVYFVYIIGGRLYQHFSSCIHTCSMCGNRECPHIKEIEEKIADRKWEIA